MLLDSILGSMIGALLAAFIFQKFATPQPPQPVQESKLPFQDPMTGEFTMLSVPEWEHRQAIAAMSQRKSEEKQESIEDVVTDLQNYVRIKQNATRK